MRLKQGSLSCSRFGPSMTTCLLCDLCDRLYIKHLYRNKHYLHSVSTMYATQKPSIPVCQSSSIPVDQYVSPLVYQYASIPVYQYVSMLVYQLSYVRGYRGHWGWVRTLYTHNDSGGYFRSVNHIGNLQGPSLPMSSSKYT